MSKNKLNAAVAKLMLNILTSTANKPNSSIFENIDAAFRYADAERVSIRSPFSNMVLTQAV